MLGKRVTSLNRFQAQPRPQSHRVPYRRLCNSGFETDSLILDFFKSTDWTNQPEENHLLVQRHPDDSPQ